VWVDQEKVKEREEEPGNVKKKKGLPHYIVTTSNNMTIIPRHAKETMLPNLVVTVVIEYPKVWDDQGVLLRDLRYQ
jgi:hypothetical protein